MILYACPYWHQHADLLAAERCRDDYDEELRAQAFDRAVRRARGEIFPGDEETDLDLAKRTGDGLLLALWGGGP